MFCIYEATWEKTEFGTYMVRFPDFPGAFEEGETLEEAIAGAAEVLKLFVAESIDLGAAKPCRSLGDAAQLVIGVEVTPDFVAESKCLSVSEAAEYLGVSSSRVSQLLSSGKLEARVIGGRRMVTIDSLNSRLANPPAPHRPKKVPAND